MCSAVWKSGVPRTFDKNEEQGFKISADRRGKRVKGKER